jgi:uncharacterized MAPEG superfamily protein
MAPSFDGIITAMALLAFAAWTFLLLLAIAVHRASLVALGIRKSNAFSPWGDDVSAFSARLCRAHANCVENLPLLCAVVVAAAATGQLTTLDPLAPYFMVARIIQSSVHIWSTSAVAVNVRFVFMLIQMVIFVIWAALLARHVLLL